MSFEPALLPLATKRELCQSICDEFGISISRETNTNELIHSCRLPFGQHANGDAKPSAALNYEKLTFRCLGCGAHGGLLWFLAAMRGEEGFSDAREWLQGRTGLGQSVMDVSTLLELLDAIYAHRATTPGPMPGYDDAVLKRWRGWVMQHPYLTEDRGIPEENLVRFGVGYAEEYFDKTERIIIPHYWRGELVGWQARQIYSYDKPKYKNSPDFPRDRTFFNDAFDQDDTCILVESPMSVLRHIHHVPNMLASFGAVISEPQTRLLAKFKRVILWLDNDNAGLSSTVKVADNLARYTSVYAVESPFYEDPADMTDGSVDRLIQLAVPYSIWTQPGELSRYDDA